MLILSVLAVAAIAVAWFVYFGLRDRMPGWGIAGAVGVIIFFAVLTWNAYRPLSDERLEAELVESGRGQSVAATVVGVQRLGSRETQDRRETLLGLMLALDSGGTARIKIAIEDALLPDFASGKKVQVLQDPQRPDRVALDRRLTRVQVQ